MNKIFFAIVAAVLTLPVVPFIVFVHVIDKFAWWLIDVPGWVNDNIVDAYGDKFAIPVYRWLGGK